MNKILLIQTAYTGDVVLATPVVEKLHQFFPAAKIDFCLRKGNQDLLKGHPFINDVLVFDKKNHKLKNLFSLLFKIRKKRYDLVINMHRFASSGLLTGFSGASEKIGFSSNPLSFLFTKKIKHEIGSGKHEVKRNLELIEHLTDTILCRPKLYPSAEDRKFIDDLQITAPYICIAPTSVWFTKQWPQEKWIALIQLIPASISIYLIGGPTDFDSCETILKISASANCKNLAGQLSYLQSAALMEQASMNYVNDSAPMHFASAMNAPVTVIYCSTVPSFGFGPLSDRFRIIETKEILACRPCGLHGYKTCPQIHYRCAQTIKASSVYENLIF